MAGVRRILLAVLLFYLVYLSGIDARRSGGSSSRSSYSRPSYSRPSYSRPSYPSSSGLSGSGSSRPSYPSSSGLSGYGGGSRPSYPSSGGLSGYGSGSKPSYPSSGGLSGYGSGSKPSYPSSGGLSGYGGGSKPSYPYSGGFSGNSRYTTSRPYSWSNHYSSNDNGWSGNNWSNNNQGSGYETFKLPQGVYNMLAMTSTTRRPYVDHSWSTHSKPSQPTVHHHHHHHHETNHYSGGYRYSPPTYVYYSSGGTTHNYPVYGGELPTYVYQYRTSENKFSKLLAGLSLYNLGASHANPQMHHYYKNYSPVPGEKCTFGVKNPHYNKFDFDSYEYEEVLIDCRLISSFLWKEYHNNPTEVKNVTTVTTNTTKTVVTSNISGTNQVLYPNGTISSLQNNSMLLPNGTISDKAMPRTSLIPIDMKPLTNATTNSSNTIPAINAANISNVNLTQSAAANVTNDQGNNNLTTTVMKTTVNNDSVFDTTPKVDNITLQESKTISPNTTVPSNNTSTVQELTSNGTIIETVKNNNETNPLNITSESQVKKLPFESLSQTILSNGTLVEEKVTTTTISTTSLVTNLSDSKLKGFPVSLEKGMECYVTRTTPTSKMRKIVDCALLQTYSENSLKKSSNIVIPSSAMIVMIAISMIFVN